MSTGLLRNPRLLPWRPWALLVLPGSLAEGGGSPSHLHHPGSAGSSSVSQTLTFLFFFKSSFCYSVTKSCLTLCHTMDCSPRGSLVLHCLPEFAQTHVHWVGDAIQPSHTLLLPSPALNLSQHKGLLQWVGSSHQVAKIWELQLQHQSFQWIFRIDFP